MKASGDALRLNILRALSGSVYSVLELCEIFHVSQPAISHHLKILSEGGLICAQRQGVYLFYRRAPNSDNPNIHKLQQSFWRALDRYALPDKYIAGIRAVTQRRTESSMQFFTRNVDKFRTQQDLIAKYDIYAPVVEDVLKTRRQNKRAMDSVLEVGPGDGAFLSVLAKYFDEIIALDISQEMLDQARHTARIHNLDNVDFIRGSTDDEQLGNLQVDCVVANMVLHHTPSPEQMIGHLHALLKPDGALIITELCAHHQDWVRTHLGDLWLGFAPEHLEQTARDAGFDVQHSSYIGQSNGFQVQVREFTRPGTSRVHRLGQTQ